VALPVTQARDCRPTLNSSLNRAADRQSWPGNREAFSRLGPPTAGGLQTHDVDCRLPTWTPVCRLTTADRRLLVVSHMAPTIRAASNTTAAMYSIIASTRTASESRLRLNPDRPRPS
jgi:hypothetical protein